MYCETPVFKTHPGGTYKQQLAMLTGRFINVQELPFHTIRVLNLIGLGFDSPGQPDYMAFAKDGGNPSDPGRKEAKKWLQPHVTSQLQKGEAVLYWAQTSNEPIRYMHLPGLGCGHFAGSMPFPQKQSRNGKKHGPTWS